MTSKKLSKTKKLSWYICELDSNVAVQLRIQSMDIF